MQRILLLSLFAVTACATPAATIDTPDLGEGGCDAESLGYLVGQSIDEIDTGTLPRPHRIIRPGTAVTMDYREDRTNLELDARDRVIRVYCG